MTNKELAEAIAIEVMGWKTPPRRYDFAVSIIPAWSMLEDKFPRGSHYIQIDTGRHEENGQIVEGWACEIVGPGIEGRAVDDSASRAICLAALRAVRSNPALARVEHGEAEQRKD